MSLTSSQSLERSGQVSAYGPKGVEIHWHPTIGSTSKPLKTTTAWFRYWTQSFDPKGIAQRLKSEVTGTAKGVLVEHGYVDKDYRSTFYNFYAKKGRHYRTDCVRLHLFDSAVRYDETRTDITCTDQRPQDHYFGYIVLRPTIVATLGRSVLSPNIRLGARGRAIQSVHYVNLLGHRLAVWGFPSMAQHVDIAVCAHVACWAILRYYSETFPASSGISGPRNYKARRPVRPWRTCSVTRLQYP